MFGLKNEEILTYFFLIIVGYCIGKMFSKSCDGFGGKACSGVWSGCNNDECNVWKRELINSNMNNLAPGGQPSDYFCYENNGNWIATSVEAETRNRNIANKRQICINCITDLNEVKCKNIGC